MSEFKQLQTKIQKALKDKESRKLSVFHAKEKLKKLDREKQQLSRIYSQDSDVFETLLDQEKNLKQKISEEESNLAEFLEAEKSLIKAFFHFSDPRKHIEEFSDDFPVLLFPVRIETRFKKVKKATGAIQHQLWVRIFPDDCSIDTFDNTLSEAELTKAKNYWINRWKAGKVGNEVIKPYIQNKEKGAWRELMGVFNAGRAYWITQNYQPINADDIPERKNENDVLLIIPTEKLPDQATQKALKDYWKTIFLANGDAQGNKAAFLNLTNINGGDEKHAVRLVETFKPENIDEEQREADTQPEVKVVFLEFPKSNEVNTKLSQWSQAARVTTFPERFVLLGYQKSNPIPIVNELGNGLPDPLIVGPDPGEDINEVLKAAFGDDFNNLPEEKKSEKYIEYLSERSDTKWLFDFDEAVRIGMGFKVDLTSQQYEDGFEKLFVLGIKLSADEKGGQSALEQLIKHHHFGESGFSILPQGTPTNKTESKESGYSETEDTEDAYLRYHPEDTKDDPTDYVEKRDGRWLAELLGINIKKAALHLTENYYHKDQCEARAMNTALWNATIGYFMESMLTPVFEDWQCELTRWFFVNHVNGRGRIPAIRIGNQPYGILPVTNFSNIQWLTQENTLFARENSGFLPYLNNLYSVLQKQVRKDWESLLNQVAYIGNKIKDPDKILLEILGLHAASVEFSQRYAESYKHLLNQLKLKEAFGELLKLKNIWDYEERGMTLLKNLGYTHDELSNPVIPMLEKFFLEKENIVKKPLIDDHPLSETIGIRAYTDSGLNYVEWLIINAKYNHRNIRDQKNFTENKIPTAILYEMLRHALNLEFFNTGLKFFQLAGIFNPEQMKTARIDPYFIGIQSEKAEFESKWDLIYQEENRIADKGTFLVDHISNLLKANVINNQTKYLNEIIAALEILKNAPTARLERAFVEHLDCCSYRLDAWLLGLVNFQLNAMRSGGHSNYGKIKNGIYLGAYGWLEKLKPEDKNLSKANLNSELKKIFNPNDDNPPMKDDKNAGYVYAPSINQALTAAVLRNGFISNASKDMADLCKVNLTSERVRMALSIIEGMQQGQRLGALLGYQLERGLHDRTDEELDIYIYELRKHFSLVSNRMILTQIMVGKSSNSHLKTEQEKKRSQEEEQEFKEDKAITKIEARNVIDGLRLLEHIKSNEKKAKSEEEKKKAREYPFGFPEGDGLDKLKPANNKQKKAINAEVNRLMNIRDAVADLAIAESVHQVVQGNYDRAAGALDTYSKGNYPQTPDVIQTPDSGIGLNHRFGIHLPSCVSPDSGSTPRSKAEPAVNKWLEDIFPDLSDICCKVEYRIPDYEDEKLSTTHENTFTISNLGLLPIDLLYMLDMETGKNLTALDDCILKFIHETEKPRPDVKLSIKYTESVGSKDKISFFEMAPLVRSLRSLVVSSRPLLPTDMMLQSEAVEKQNALCSIDSDRIIKVKQLFDGIQSDLENDFLSVLSLLIDQENFENTMSNKNQIIAQIDSLLGHFVNHLHGLNQFGMPQTGFGFIYDRKCDIFGAIFKKVYDHQKRLEEKKDTFEELMTIQFPAADSDEERIDILQKAERTISTTHSIPVPSISDYQTVLVNKKGAFDNKIAEMNTFLNKPILNLHDLINDINTLKTNLTTFDLLTIETKEDEKKIIVFAEDLLNQAEKLNTMIKEKSKAVQKLLDQHDASAVTKEKTQALTQAAKILFGEDFQIVPEFNLVEDHGNEIQNCIDNRKHLLSYQINDQENDFPVDDWLYGMARVREKMGHWENLVILAEGFKDRPPLNLTPIQLPFNPNDSWLGMDYPEGLEIEGDKLLYTAYLPDFNPVQTQCGLFVDEWTEVIPSKKETTGLTFHYDRPDSEPPQTLLLVTPSAFGGGWKWDDIVNTMHETLKLAKLRSIEPDHIEKTDYAKFLPATIAAVSVFPVTMILNYAMQAHQDAGANGEIL